jgi:hypothetical protein
MIEDVFKLVEAPVDRAGLLIPDLVDGVASPNWLPDASARMLDWVFRFIRTRIEGGPAQATSTTRPTMKNGMLDWKQQGCRYRGGTLLMSFEGMGKSIRTVEAPIHPTDASAHRRMSFQLAIP